MNGWEAAAGSTNAPHPITTKQKGQTMAFDMQDYIDVKTRVLMFHKRHPDGRLTFEFMGIMPGNPSMIWGIAKAYRTPDDITPVTGHAAELAEGKTSFTRGSELQNLETSAIGRAIGMMGIGIDKSMATLDEVQHAKSRQNAPESRTEPAKAIPEDADPWGEKNPTVPGNRVGASFNAELMTEPQRKAIFAICKENADLVVKNFKAAQGIGTETKLSKRDASKLIETIKANGYAEFLGAN